MKLSGIIPPMVTPFRAEDEELDEEALRREARYLLGLGVHGLSVCGSTGEGHTVTLEEAARAYRAVVEEANGRVPVLAGIIVDCTREAVRRGLAAKEAGVAALMVTPVHYLFAPGDDGIYAYYQAIGERVGLPIVIYDVVPQVYISAKLMARLTEIPQVVGIKQSGGDIHKLADLVKMVGDRTTIFSALDDVLYPSFILGAQGSISGIAACLPKQCLQLWEAVQAGRHAEALALHNRLLPVWRACGGSRMPALIKEALNQQGRLVGVARSPQLPPTPEEKERIRAALTEAGAIPAAVS